MFIPFEKTLPPPIKKPDTKLNPYIVSGEDFTEGAFLGFAHTVQEMKRVASRDIVIRLYAHEYFDIRVKRIWETWPYKVLQRYFAVYNQPHIITGRRRLITCLKCDFWGEINKDNLCISCYEAIKET